MNYLKHQVLRCFFLGFGLALLMTPTSAVQASLGIGVVLGDPTGVTGKYFMTREQAIDLSMGWSHGRIHLVSSYLWHGVESVPLDNVALDYYLGVGLKLEDRRVEVGPPPTREESETQLGVRFPLGLRYQFKSPSIEVFGELAPTLNLSPSSSFDIAGGVGARYFF